MTVVTKANNHLLGIALSVAGYTAWVAGDAGVKLAGQTISVVQILAINFAVSMALTALAASLHGGVRQIRTHNPQIHLMRSVYIMGATAGSFVGVQYLSLADFYTVIFTSPIFLIILSSIFLHERVGVEMWGAILLGFAGVVGAVQFSDMGSTHASWLGILATCIASLSLAMTMLTVRSASRENHYAIAFWPQVAGVIVCAILILYRQDYRWDADGLLFAILSGLVGGAGALLTNASLKLAPAAVVSPYHYTQIIGGALVGYLVWGHLPSWSVVMGAVMVMLSGLWILRIQMHAKQTGAEAPVA